MIEIKAPSSRINASGLKIFLAGSIEMGTASAWQQTVVNALRDFPITIFNPRRDTWNSPFEESINNPVFCEQVNWELDALSEADIIAMYFDPATKAPITLLEFGENYKSNKLVVACPPGFWRRGNLEVCCKRQNIELLNSLDDLIQKLTFISGVV